MLSRREITLIILLIVVLAGAGYYFLFLQPTLADITSTQNAIANKNNTLKEARDLVEDYKKLGADHEAMIPDWETFEEGVPDFMDDAEVLRVIQKIIYSYTKVINVNFTDDEIELTPLNEDAEAEEDDEASVVSLNRVVIEFMVPYDEIAPILKSFKEEKLVNRIVEYTISRGAEAMNGEINYMLTLNVDFLTQN